MKNFIKLTKEIFAGLLLISLLAITSCSKNSDPAPTNNNNNATGTIASTCTSSTSGTGSFKVNGTSLTGEIVFGICSSNEYTATIGRDGNAVIIQFKGMPNAGTFAIKDPAEYASTAAKNVVFIGGGTDGSTADFLSGNLSQLVTVERNGNTIRFKLPSVQLKTPGTNTTATFEADFSVTF